MKISQANMQVISQTQNSLFILLNEVWQRNEEAKKKGREDGSLLGSWDRQELY